MPTRLLRDWTDSTAFRGISAEAERLFGRLLMKADDFGRFHADIRLIRALVFPHESDRIMRRVEPALAELAERGLIRRYSVGGKDFLAVPKFGQRLRLARSRFPPPDGESADWLPGDDGTARTNDRTPRTNDRGLRADDRNVRPDSDSDSDVHSDVHSHADSDSDGGQEPRADDGMASMIAAIRTSRPEYAHMRPADIGNALRPAFGKPDLPAAVAQWCADQANATAPMGNPMASVRKMVARLCDPVSASGYTSPSARRHAGARGKDVHV